MSAQEFETYRLEIRKYRDMFVAHLDDLNNIQTPHLRIAISRVEFLYDYLVNVEDDVAALVDAPQDPKARYQQHLREGRAAHQL